MASRNIAIQITLGGIEQSINSISELETAIKQATLELKNFTGSSEERQRLVDQLKGANSQLIEFKKNIRGVSVDQQIGKFLQLGSLITSTFATASTVLSSLGRDSENFAEAQAKAQQILTVAFAASEIARQKDTIQTIRNTAAQIGATLATQGLGGALRALFTIIKANPLGALLAVVTAIVSAMIAFGNSSKKAAGDLDELTKAQDNYNASVRQGTIDTTQQYNSIIALNTAYLAGQITLEDFNAELDRLVPNLSNINVNTKEGRRLVDEYAQALLGQGQIEAKIAAEREILSAAQKANNKEEVQAAQFRIQNLIFEGKQFRDEIARIESINKKIADDELERQKRLKEAQDKRLELLRAELELFRQKQEQDRENLKNLLKVQEFSQVDAKIIQDLEERIKRLQQLRKEQESLLPIQEQYNKFLEDLISLPSDQAGSEFFQLFSDINDSLINIQKNGPLSAEVLDNIIGDYQRRIAELKSQGIFSEEDLKNVDGFFSNVVKQFNIINKLKREGFDFDFTSLIESVRDLNIELADELNLEEQLKISEQLKNLKDNFVEQYTQVILKSDEFQKKINSDAGKVEGGLALIQEEAKKNAESTFESISNLTLELQNFKGGVIGTAFELEILLSKLGSLSNVELFDKIKNNLDVLTKVITPEFGTPRDAADKLLKIQEEIQNKTFDQQKTFQQDITNLEASFRDKQIDISKLSYEAKLFLLKEFLEKEVSETEDAEKKKQDAQQKTIDKFVKSVQDAQVALQAIQQTVSDFYNFQFDQLEKRNKRIQDSIVGDSKRANELRLEADKAYQAERERLEKKQAKITLRLTLAQTVANVAQAVAQNLGNPIVAAIILGAGAAQVAIVNAQLNAIDSYKRGGRIKKHALGGMVNGPSHENGGVKFQGGGVELEGNEAVINRLSTLRYADILSTINQAGGGRPIVMSGFDDSRIVEAIAKQRSTPIRAYVVESDISNAQTINKRLELLSQI